MRFDLHVHSTASDGALTPAQLVQRACELELSALAITDHDSVGGITTALCHAEDTSLHLIPGVELSTVHQSRDVHILGYFVDPDDARFKARLAELRDARRDRAAAMVDALEDAGYSVTLDEVLLLAEGGSVGRSHVARALVNRGHVDTIGEAFERFIGRDKPFYVAKPVAGPVEVVESILQAGGVAVLAHPGVTKIDDAIPDLVAAGLQGLEAFHAEHTTAMRDRYRALAEKLGLIVTGGSDFHGLSSPGSALGSVKIPDSVLPRLYERAGRTWEPLG